MKIKILSSATCTRKGRCRVSSQTRWDSIGNAHCLNGSLVWFPKKTSYGYKMGWSKFDQLMQRDNLLREKINRWLEGDACVMEIVHGERSISDNTALRLARYFNLSERFWLNPHSRYDLEVEKDKLNDRIESEVKVL